jgi:hypothetical protein
LPSFAAEAGGGIIRMAESPVIALVPSVGAASPVLGSWIRAIGVDFSLQESPDPSRVRGLFISVAMPK